MPSVSNNGLFSVVGPIFVIPGFSDSSKLSIFFNASVIFASVTPDKPVFACPLRRAWKNFFLKILILSRLKKLENFLISLFAFLTVALSSVIPLEIFADFPLTIASVCVLAFSIFVVISL